MRGPEAQVVVRPRKAGVPQLLWQRLIRSFLPRFLGSCAFFVAIFLLADLFSNLWRFLSLEAPVRGILVWLGLGVPVHLSEILPVALLFAMSYTLAEAHASGELLVIFGSGVSLYRYSAPLIALCALLAVGGFAFNDAAAVPAAVARTQLSRELLRQKVTYSAGSVTLLSDGGVWIYRVGRYDDSKKMLNTVEVVGRNSDFVPARRITAESARWDGTKWFFRNARVFSLTASGDWTEATFPEWSDSGLDEPPESFRGVKGDIKSMKREELSEYAAFLKAAGLPHAEADAEYQRRFAYALAPLIVGLIAAATCGMFRKNTLLMSLLLSLSAATVYYVAQMMGMLMAKTGATSPVFGAWGPALLFLTVSGIFFAKVRT